MRCGARVPGVVQAHPHSAVSRCSEVWSPALPPSVRTGSGHSGTARTLGREARWSSRPPPIPTSAPSRRGARPQLPTLQHLALAHGAVRGVHSPRPLGPRLTALCTHAPGQPTGTGTQPSLGNCRARAWRHNHDRRTADRSPGTRGLTSRSVWCHFPADWVRDAGVRLEDAVGTYAPHRTESRRVPDCTPGRELGDGLSGTWCQFR